MSRDLKAKLEEAAWSDMAKWTSWIIAGGCGVLAAVFGAYVIFFGHYSISSDPADWGVFGDFVGGTANPILSFLTIALLAITIILQARQLAISSRELRLSREELELSRAELKRSALAQELSEKALKAQASSAEATAQLAAINALLSYYGQEIGKHKGQNYPTGDVHSLELQGYRRRQDVLKQRLEHFYTKLTGDDDGK